MTKVYCGSKKPPKNRTIGNVEQCKRQIRLFGLKSSGLPKVTINSTKQGKVYCGAKTPSKKTKARFII